jgi:hypothetical protein
MKLHLDIKVAPSPFQIKHNTPVLLIGSCFSEHIGERLSAHRFQVLSNPAGVLFSPLCIHDFLQRLIRNEKADERYFIESGGSWYSHQYRGIESATAAGLAARINDVNHHTFEFLCTAEIIIITFGTAYYYHHIGINGPVANNLKQPAGNFIKKQLTVDAVTGSYKKLISEIKRINPLCRFIFSVSPVKHIRDGVIENNISKAVLLLAASELCRETQYVYFPSYELVNDDLRDYRFYKKDMAHPNEQAVDYIWEKFGGCFFDDETRLINSLAEKLNTAMAHLPKGTNEVEKQKFNGHIRQLENQLHALLGSRTFQPLGKKT